MKKTITKLIILISIILILFSNNVFALENLNSYDPSPTLNSSDSFITKAEPILGFIQNIGMIVALIALAIIGLKYMFTSPEGKADYKKEMIPYIVGCFMLGGVSLILGIISELSF